MSIYEMFGYRGIGEAWPGTTEPAYPDKPVQEIIDSQKSIAEDLKAQIVPMDEFVAANTTMKGKLTVYGGPSSVLLEDGTGVGRSCTVYETAIFDFENKTITKQYTGGYRAMNSDPATGIYNRKNPICEAAFSIQSTTYYSGCLNDVVNHLSNSYQKQMDLLKDTLSGEALEGEAKDLDAFFIKSQQSVSASFSQMVGGFLDGHGQSGYTQKVYSSVQSLFVAKYQFQTAGKDTPDDCYTLQELDYTAASISAYQSVLDSAYENGSDTGKLSAKLSKVDIAVEQMSLRLGGGSLLDALRKARPSIHQSLAENIRSFQSRYAREGSLNARG